jgi:formate hydrogenlyase subunit 3/multisubunit Na+/H+ antiporter MnhD subunit
MSETTLDAISAIVCLVSCIIFIAVMCFAGDDWDDDKGKGE